MIHKNQSFKELLSQHRGTPNKGTAIAVLLQKRCRKRHLTPQRQTYSKPEKSVRRQKTSQKL
jgi:hypothetical protein